MRIDVYLHDESSSSHELLELILQKVNSMSANLDDLTAKVAATKTVAQSAVVLLQGLKAKLDAAGTDPAALKALSDSLADTDQQLADAVTANTPAAP
jgi:hypothetical protein